MRRLFSVCCALLVFATVRAQPDAAPSWKLDKRTFVYAVKEGDTLRLDRYVALSPDSRIKPCLLFLFGGGFMTGRRDNRRFQPFFDYYARKGFVVVSMDYRLGMKRAKEAGLLDKAGFREALTATIDMATEDLYDATAFICRCAPQWGVDATRIVACGSSAGAITVLTGEYGLCNDAPKAAEKLPANFNYAGVIAFAGAIYDDRTEMRWAHDPAPMMLFHGDADRNVPYETLTLGDEAVFGSKRIARELTRRNSPHWFYSVAETNHAMAWRPMSENRDEIDAFLDKLVFDRQRLMIDTHVTPVDAPPLPKAFRLEDYIEANYGH